MKKTILLLLTCFTYGLANADPLSVSSKEPITVVAPDHWKSTKDKPPSNAFPFEIYRVEPPTGRNAVCLVSAFDKDKPEFADAKFLKKILRGDSRPYVSSPDDLPKLELKEIKINGGLGFYVNFVDPDLVGKPVKQGDYKTATPILMSLGSKYLIKVTLLCDEIDGADYRDLMTIVKSIKIKPE